MSVRASDLFFQAIAKRRISLKAVARIAGCSPISVERLRLGHTRKLDIELVVKVARSLPDAQDFMREVLPDFIPSGMPTSDISELRGHIIDIKHMVAGARGRRETPVEAGWVLDDGSFAPAPDGLDATAARLAGLSPQGRGDIVDYVCRGFGWIAFGAAGDERQIRFDRAHVDPKACLQALRVLEETATEHFAVKAGPEPASLETRDDGVLLSGATLFYEDDCILLGLDYSRRNIGRAEIPPDTAILFRFAFRNLGELTLR